MGLRTSAVGASTALAALAGLNVGARRLIEVQAAHADVKVRPLTTAAPPYREFYGDPAHPLVRLALLGDSSAEGVGVADFDESLGGHLGRDLAAEGFRVQILLAAVNGACADSLADQVKRVIPEHPTLAAISIGANDVRARTPVRIAAQQVADAVTALQDAGAHVVVGTTPNLGIMTEIAQPLRFLAGVASRRLERAQGRAVRKAGGTVVPLGALLSPLFAAERSHFAPDGFHPSDSGYALIAKYLLPPLLSGL
jgi:lysophospholipase L1-like esterase